MRVMNKGTGSSDSSVRRRRRQSSHPDDHVIGLAATNPIAHHYAAPLFRAGVAFVAIGTWHDHFRALESDKHHWVYIVMEGELEVRIGRRRKHVCAPGMICVVPEGIEWARRGLTSIRCVQFSLRCLPRWDHLRVHGARVRAYEFADPMKALVSQLLRFYQLGTVADKKAALGVSRAIVPLLEEETGQGDPRPSQHAQELEELFGQIREDPGGDWQLSRMTEHTGLPVRTLTRHCQRVYGTSPLELVHRQRLVRACELMAAGMAPDAVGRQVGYSDRASFSNMFYRHMGMRPTEYIKRTSQG